MGFGRETDERWARGENYLKKPININRKCGDNGNKTKEIFFKLIRYETKLLDWLNLV